MSKRRLNVPSSGRLAELDLVSYGRRGRETPLRFSQAQLEQIDRTVRGVSEVMVKVSGGGKTLDAVKAHVGYIDRHGKLKVNTDEGERLGKGLAEELVYDWHLDVGKGQYRPLPKAGEKDRRPRQAHNIVFSMPAGTSPQKLLAATQKFAREKFALRHRYAMVLHTDQGHPHVHLVVKATSEQGERLSIRKDTLRQWRDDFAGYLRELGVPANATPIQLRGKPKAHRHDRVYRSLKRGQSTFMRRKVEGVAQELLRGALGPEPGKAKLIATRERVLIDWKATTVLLRAQGQESLARNVEEYISQMPAVATDKERIAKGLLVRVVAERSREPSAERERSIGERAR